MKEILQKMSNINNNISYKTQLILFHFLANKGDELLFTFGMEWEDWQTPQNITFPITYPRRNQHKKVVISYVHSEVDQVKFEEKKSCKNVVQFLYSTPLLCFLFVTVFRKRTCILQKRIHWCRKNYLYH